MICTCHHDLQIETNINTQKIYWELQNIMRLANCRNLKEITRDKLIIRK